MSEIDPTQLPEQSVSAAAEVETSPVVAPEAPSATTSAAPEAAPSSKITTKEAVVECLERIAQGQEPADRSTLDHLRTVFYRLHNEEIAAQRQAFVEAGGEESDYSIEVCPLEADYKELMSKIRQQRAKAAEDAEAQRQTNLQRKLAIIDEIKHMVEQSEDVDKNYDRFKELQAEWKTIGQIPAEEVTSSWKSYHHQVEQFYDLLRINHEMRAYDFKKNLEVKLALCEAAEKLTTLDDVISAFHQLQTLHQEYRETGPVAKEDREAVWTRFKNASTLVNKRHQDHFLGIKQQEEENLKQKEALCEQAEALSIEGLSSAAEWDAMAQLVMNLQAEWKTIGYAPRKQNQEIYERFRASCDRFFTAKSAYYRSLREVLATNLAAKTRLCEQAEALAQSNDWAATTKALMALQAEWKTIGPVAHKLSDGIWKRFNQACNSFFDRKKEANSVGSEEEQENLNRKLDVIARLEKLVAEGSEQLHNDVKALQAEWTAIGHVPFRQKEKTYRRYRAACDKLYETIHEESGRLRVNKLVERVAQTGGNERQRLQRIYDQKKAEIQTYETNLSFLTTKSKKGSSVIADIERRIETLKNDLQLLAEKIAEIKE